MNINLLYEIVCVLLKNVEQWLLHKAIESDDTMRGFRISKYENLS